MTLPASHSSSPLPRAAVDMRRAIDILCSGVAAMVLMPVFVIVAVAIWIESGRPILYSQLRLGQNGRHFMIYKFRKFRPNCDPHGYPLTMETDSRMTAMGRVLAATKLDELPQLWNVLRGDMSFVGPRPESIAFTDCFRNEFASLLHHKPGLFGPCQVLFRHESRLYPADETAADYYRQVLFPAKAKIDLAYFPSRTFVSDLGWILRAAGLIAIEAWAVLTRRIRSS